MKTIGIFIFLCTLTAAIAPSFAEEGREKVIIRLPEFIIFSDEQLQEEKLQEAPPAKPEKAAPF